MIEILSIRYTHESTLGVRIDADVLKVTSGRKATAGSNHSCFEAVPPSAVSDCKFLWALKILICSSTMTSSR